jgi:hypothetical protein
MTSHRHQGSRGSSAVDQSLPTTSRSCHSGCARALGLGGFVVVRPESMSLSVSSLRFPAAVPLPSAGGRVGGRMPRSERCEASAMR